jgi:D-sedoheptulose 7-phosphate isomerase
MTAAGPTNLVADALRETARLHEQAAVESPAVVASVAVVLQAAFAADHKVLMFGNGGSALDAQHFAAELVGRFARERRALPAISLTTDTSILTSVANDYAYERVFARQVEALGRAGDVAVGISTSGASANILAGLKAAKARGMTTVAFTGRDGGAIGAIVDVHVNVPHAVTARIQEVHRSLIHAVCELVEQDL